MSKKKRYKLPDLLRKEKKKNAERIEGSYTFLFSFFTLQKKVTDVKKNICHTEERLSFNLVRKKKKTREIEKRKLIQTFCQPSLHHRNSTNTRTKIPKKLQNKENHLSSKERDHKLS